MGFGWFYGCLDVPTTARTVRTRLRGIRWTGYWYDDIKDHEIMKHVDVLVDGPFVRELKDNTLKWRGSSNQRVIDVQKSRQTGEIVLYCECWGQTFPTDMVRYKCSYWLLQIR